MAEKLRVANIGMKFGMSHVEGAMACDAEIAALCDSNEENLRFAGERYSIPEDRWFTDYKDIVNNKDIDVATVAIMKFNDNLMGKVFVSTGCKRDYTMRTCIYGTKGTVICDNTSPTMTLFTVDEEGVVKEAETVEIVVNNHNAAGEFEVFADAIINNKPILTDAREGAKTVEVCLAIVESSQTGEKVVPKLDF